MFPPFCPRRKTRYPAPAPCPYVRNVCSASAQRFTHWKLLRALALPGFLRSTARGPRVIEFVAEKRLSEL
jgi:hypothetical protein